MLALLAAVALAMPGPLPEGEHWARFSRIPALSGRDNPGVVVRVGILAEHVNSDRTIWNDYWFEREIVLLGSRQSVMWADTRSCPSAQAQLARMAALRARYVRLGNEGSIDVVADGARYTLDAPIDEGNGSIHIETTSRGPIRAWVDAMLAALEPCWTGTRPVLARPR